MQFKKSITSQTAIFFGYLVLLSLLLFDKSGGMDVAFAVILGTAIFLHVLILLVMVLRSFVKKIGKPPYIDLFTVILLANIFILILPSYLEFMWQLTGRV